MKKSNHKYTIYLLVREDGLKYVGVTVNLRNRIYQHNTSTRFKDYKIKDVHILEECIDQDIAINREKYWVQRLGTFKEGLNHTPTGGGIGGEHFNTLGVSYIKGKIWCFNPNTGKHRAVINESMIPEGWVKGRAPESNGMLGKQHSQETKARLSEMRKGRVHSIKFSENDIRQLFKLYKNRPILDCVGEYTDAAKKLRRSYERAFALTFSKQFNMTPNYIHNLLTKRSLKWDYIWAEEVGEPKRVSYTNT